MNTSERFWAKADKSGSCWEWTACKNIAGYGQFGLDGTMKYAHRVAYELEVGQIPQDMCVCHNCDNTSCVNPDHLFLGTDKDNAEDRTKKGRSCTGENHHSSKLTKEQILQIRNEPGSLSVMSQRFGVSRQHVSRIRNFRNWAHVA